MSVLPWHVATAKKSVYALKADGETLCQNFWCPFVRELTVQVTNLLLRLPCQQVYLLGLLEVLSLHDLLLQVPLVSLNMPETQYSTKITYGLQTLISLNISK